MPRIEINYIEDTAIITDFRPCYCLSVGKDDGEYICWKHHDCSLGLCTHAEEDE